MNSVLQALSHSRLSKQAINACRFANTIGQCKLICQFVEIMQTLWISLGNKDLTNSLNTLKNLVGDSTFRQKDAFEFFLSLLSGLKEESLIAEQFNDFCKLFEMENEHQYLCGSCGNENMNQEITNYYRIEVKFNTEELDVVKKFEDKQETLNLYYCKVCKCKSNSSILKTRIAKLPAILVIHPSQDPQCKKKWNKPPVNLNIAVRDQKKMYELFAVSNHVGSQFSGHYTACCRTPQNQWYHLNDSNVSHWSDGIDVQRLHIPKDYRPHILFYEEIDL